MYQYEDTQAIFQHTLADSFSCIGPGIHTGITTAMTVMPADAGTGYVFFRKDVQHDMGLVPARWHTVSDTKLSTTVANRFGVRVSTIEHLVAALHAAGVNNARIVLDGPEVPIMDGSAQCFTQFIHKVGLKPQQQLRQAIVITQPLRIEVNGAVALLEPSPIPIFEMHIDFPNTAIGQQAYSSILDPLQFSNNLASARTFGLTQQIEALKSSGHAKGGSLKNAIIVDGEKVLNAEGLRYKDEFARHKTLDSIGDLALAGATIIGKFIGYKSGHELNNLLLKKLMQSPHCWVYTTLKMAQKKWPSMVHYPQAV